MKLLPFLIMDCKIRIIGKSCYFLSKIKGGNLQPQKFNDNSGYFNSSFDSYYLYNYAVFKEVNYLPHKESALGMLVAFDNIIIDRFMNVNIVARPLSFFNDNGIIKVGIVKEDKIFPFNFKNNVKVGIVVSILEGEFTTVEVLYLQKGLYYLLGVGCDSGQNGLLKIYGNYEIINLNSEDKWVVIGWQKQLTNTTTDNTILSFEPINLYIAKEIDVIPYSIIISKNVVGQEPYTHSIVFESSKLSIKNVIV